MYGVVKPIQETLIKWLQKYIFINKKNNLTQIKLGCYC